MAGNFSEFGPAESGARLAELDHQADISASMQNLMRFSQMQEADAKLPLIKAEARKTGAEADVLEQKAALQKRMAALMANRTPGSSATSGGNLAYEMADIAGQAGDVDSATKYLLRGSQVESAQANRAYRSAQAVTQQYVQLRDAANLVGSMASGVSDQASLDRMLGAATSMGLDVSQVPTTYDANTKGVLKQLKAQGMTVAQHANEEIAKARLKIAETTGAAAVRARNAQISASDSRIRLLDERYRQAVKNDGERSPEALALRKEQTALIKTRREVLEAMKPTPIPSDSTQRQPGKVYLWTDGKTKVVWDKNPATGKMQAREVAPAEESKLSKMGSSVMGALKSLGSDDTVDEEDDDE